jgi:GNAT superfamily N-acetyltransferase
MRIEKIKHSKELLREIALIAFDKSVYEELGYPVYSDFNHTWYLLYDEGILIGFCAVVDKKNYTSFNHDYILPEYRNKGLYDTLFRARIEDISGKIKAVSTRKSINTFLRYGFEIKRKTKNYTFVELWKN